jgi:hypothetical protein
MPMNRSGLNGALTIAPTFAENEEMELSIPLRTTLESGCGPVD